MGRGRCKAAVWSALSVASLRLRGRASPPVAETGGACERVFIGPANSAGQGYAWARSLERVRPGTVATSMQFVHEDDRFRFAVDQSVLSGFGAHSRRWQRAQATALSGYSAVIVESALPVLGGMLRGDVASQIALLRANGVAVALLFHGSDIRSPDAHMLIEPLSYFADDDTFAAVMRTRALESKRLVESSGAPAFVSTPDLLDDLPSAIWLPLTVNVAEWRTHVPALAHGGAPIVLHAPSSSHVKGTALVEPALLELHEAGEIVYRRAEGLTHQALREAVQRADIVVDQFRIGSYGAAACEAMAAGRVVLGHVSSRVRERVWAVSGEQLPIVQATPDSITQVIRALVADRQEAARISAAGKRFVDLWHNGSAGASVLSDWLDTVRRESRTGDLKDGQA